ncbi:MAG: hypothetical protein M1817_004983 [Caeruleum heppii]|nr:MAG: hypothetical protein M1817_004983 [Caeruleum heppii]
MSYHRTLLLLSKLTTTTSTPSSFSSPPKTKRQSTLPPFSLTPLTQSQQSQPHATMCRRTICFHSCTHHREGRIRSCPEAESHFFTRTCKKQDIDAVTVYCPCRRCLRRDFVRPMRRWWDVRGHWADIKDWWNPTPAVSGRVPPVGSKWGR